MEARLLYLPSTDVWLVLHYLATLPTYHPSLDMVVCLWYCLVCLEDILLATLVDGGIYL
jgi:hypothetical protein